MYPIGSETPHIASPLKAGGIVGEIIGWDLAILISDGSGYLRCVDLEVGPAIQEPIFYQGTLFQAGDIEKLTPIWRTTKYTY